MVQRWDYESLYPSEDGDWVKYSDYAALKELTDKLVKLRRGGCMSFIEQKTLDDLLKEYKYD